MAKKLIISAILFAVLLGGTGCMDNNNNASQHDSSKNVRELAIEYMEQKYGEKFEYVQPWGNSMSGTLRFFVSRTSLPEQIVLVQVDNYTQEDRVFRDNYIAVKYQQKSLDFFSECAIKTFGEANTFYTEPYEGLSVDLSTETTFEEFLADRFPIHEIYVEVKESNYRDESQLKDISQLIGEHGTRYLLQVVIINDLHYGTHDKDTIKDTLEKSDVERRAIIRNEDGSVEIDWLFGG